VVNGDHVKPFVAVGGKSVRRCRSDDDDVAGGGKNLFAIHHHCCLAGEDDAGLRIGMLVQSRSFPGLEVAQKEGNPSPVGLTFKLDAGDFAFSLIAAMQDLEHLRSSRCGFLE
jgi:hypothetical protein